MRPAVLFSFALAGGVTSAQFVTSITQAQPATTGIAQLGDVRVVKRATTSTESGEETTTTSKKTTSTTATTTAKTTSTTLTTAGTTTTTAKTTSTTGKTTSSTSHTSSTSQTSATTTAGRGAESGASSSAPGEQATDTASTTDAGSSASASSSGAAQDASSNGTGTQSKGLSAGAAAGIAIGSVLGALAIAGAGFFFWRKRRGGVRGAVVTADYPPQMSDPFSRPGPEPTLPSLSPSPGPSGPSRGMSQGPYSSLSSVTDASATAYSSNWPGANASAYAPAQNQTDGYQPLSYEDRMEPVGNQTHDSYQNLLPAQGADQRAQGSSDRYEPLRHENAEATYGHDRWEGPQYNDQEAEDRHSDLPAFMVPGGVARRTSFPVTQPPPTISLEPPTPVPAVRQLGPTYQDQARTELPA